MGNICKINDCSQIILHSIQRYVVSFKQLKWTLYFLVADATLETNFENSPQFCDLEDEKTHTCWFRIRQGDSKHQRNKHDFQQHFIDL